ncbi:E3 ubiquitin-protein ligase TRIM33-like [Conger conger]|uniref:E3 ubiquitin-protein ligase TRIM33-like n=1 Tax=Conger conger TaxID=82655 RepID=UPI002A5A6A35|nr:E3 ubiquitin-protein ligase TRIM33-like [Conger conger]
MFCDGCVTGDWFKPPPAAAKDDGSKTAVSPRPALKFGHCGACLARLAPDRRPQLLPCLHSLCLPCVSRSLAADYGACPGCPVCGMQYSPEHVTGDLFYKDSRGDTAKPVSECGGCGAVGAGGWCVECAEDLCPTCVSAHQRVKVTRLHTVLRLPENPPTGSFWTAYCPSHRREAARLFCQSCEELVCRICEQTLHKGHRFQFVMNAVVKERAALKPLTEHVKQQRTQVRNSLSDLDRRLQDVNALRTQLNDELKDTVLRIRDALLKRALSLCLEVQELCLSEERKIRERQEALKKLEERLTYLLSFTDRALDTEGYSALLAYKSKIQCQFEDLASCDVSPGISMVTAAFCRDSEICSKIQTFGKLVVKMVPFACTGDQNGQGVPESRTGDGRPLVPRVSLVRLPVSFPLPGGPLPQFRLATSTGRQEVLLEQIPEEGQFSCPDSKSLRPLSLRPLVPPLSLRPLVPPLSLRPLEPPLEPPPVPPLEPPLVPPPGGRGRCALCHTAGALSSCSECGRSFHSDCLLTPICTADSGRWQCMVCEDQSDIRVHQSSLSETDPTLSLPDQRECKRLFLTLISDEYSAVLYQQPEWLSDSSPYVDVTLIRDRLLHRLSPAYRTLEFVSDVWLLLSSLPKGPQDVKPVERLQRIFQKALMKTFGPSLQPSLLEPPPGKEVAGAGGATGPQGATDTWQTKRKRKRKRKEEAVKKEQAEPLMKKLCKDEEGWRDGGRSGVMNEEERSGGVG